jgi:hypothetical protein
MNKILISIVVVSTIFSNTSIAHANDTVVNNKVEEKKVTEDEYLQNVNRFNKLNMKEIYSKFENKETFVLYLGRKTCPHCRKFSPILKEFNILYGNKLNYYDIESPDLDKDAKVFLSKLHIPGVPAVLYVKEGKVVNGWAGIGITAKGLYDRFFKEDTESIEKRTMQESNISRKGNNVIETNKELITTNERIEKIQISKNNVEVNKVKVLPKTSSVR